MIGEARHRRSYLYERAGADAASQLHGGRGSSTTTPSARSPPSTPGSPSGDGTKLLIVAERDGDTVSPRARRLPDGPGARRSRSTSCKARVAANLAAERALRENGKRLFAPIAAEVTKVTADASAGARLRAREGALRLRLEAHHAGRATSSRPSTCSTPTRRSATRRSTSGSRRATRSAARPPTSSPR